MCHKTRNRALFFNIKTGYLILILKIRRSREVSSLTWNLSSLTLRSIYWQDDMVILTRLPVRIFLECIDRDMKRYHLWWSIYNPQAMCIFFASLVYLRCGLILQFYITGTGTIIQSPQSAKAEYWWMPHMSKINPSSKCTYIRLLLSWDCLNYI